MALSISSSVQSFLRFHGCCGEGDSEILCVLAGMLVRLTARLPGGIPTGNFGFEIGTVVRPPLVEIPADLERDGVE